MRSRNWKSWIRVLSLTILLMPMFAKAETRIITIDGRATIAGKELKHDVFAFKINDTHLVVMRGSKVVAEATGHWEPRNEKYAADAVVLDDDGRIQELRFRGETRAFIINRL